MGLELGRPLASFVVHRPYLRGTHYVVVADLSAPKSGKLILACVDGLWITPAAMARLYG